MGKADLHIHTSWSDGPLNPQEIIAHFLRKNSDYQRKFGVTFMDVIAVTDHNGIRGAEKTREIAEKYKVGIEVIVGQEVFTRQGHVLALDLKKPIPFDKDLDYVLENIHEQGGLAIAAHPYASIWMKGWIGVRDLIKTKPFDGVETKNSYLPEVFSNWYTHLVNSRNQRLAEVAGNDAHFSSALDKVHTFFPGKTKEDLLKAIRDRRTEPLGKIWGIGEIEEHASDLIRYYYGNRQ